MSMDERETVFGINKLDNLSLGELRPGTLILAYGPTGTGKSSLGAHYLFKGASMGQNVTLLTTDPPSSVAASFQRSSVYDSSWIKDGYITIFMVQNLLDLIGVERDGADYKDMRLLSRLICQMIEAMDLKRLLIDPGRPIMDLMVGLDQTSLIHDIKATLSKMGASAVFIYDTGIIDPWDIDRLPHPNLFDVIVRCDRDEGGASFANTMTVQRWKGAAHSRSTYILDISEQGIMAVPRIERREGD
jgi:KaiC/GvpD/RAD55 family RecA-like ATPase